MSDSYNWYDKECLYWANGATGTGWVNTRLASEKFQVQHTTVNH